MEKDISTDSGRQLLHDINNPMTVLAGRLMILRSRLSAEELRQSKEIQAELDALERALERLKQIFQQMS